MHNEVYVVAGTDTGIGKTVVSAALVQALDAHYWKPVQSGLDGETDTQAVCRLASIGAERVIPERYRLRAPLSPHRSAELDEMCIDPASLTLPSCPEPLVVELAGGLLVPLTRTHLQIELLAAWNVPVVLVARSGLGTINHSLLSIDALRQRAIPLLGLVFVGEPNADNERTILEFSQTRRIGRLPLLEPLNTATLHAAFDQHFDRAIFKEPCHAQA